MDILIPTACEELASLALQLYLAEKAYDISCEYVKITVQDCPENVASDAARKKVDELKQQYLCAEIKAVMPVVRWVRAYIKTTEAWLEMRRAEAILEEPAL